MEEFAAMSADSETKLFSPETALTAVAFPTMIRERAYVLISSSRYDDRHTVAIFSPDLSPLGEGPEQRNTDLHDFLCSVASQKRLLDIYVLDSSHPADAIRDQLRFSTKTTGDPSYIGARDLPGRELKRQFTDNSALRHLYDLPPTEYLSEQGEARVQRTDRVGLLRILALEEQELLLEKLRQLAREARDSETLIF